MYTTAQKEMTYERIGGWLILLAIGLVISPLKIGVTMIKDLLPVFVNGSWSILTTPGSHAYHPLWAPLLIFEVVGNMGTIVLCSIILWFFFHKSRITPQLIIAFLVINLALIGGDLLLSSLIPSVAQHSKGGAIRELSRSVLGAAIWIPYCLRSKRVKATFVR
jgi:hypothetical protein